MEYYRMEIYKNILEKIATNTHNISNQNIPTSKHRKKIQILKSSSLDYDRIYKTHAVEEKVLAKQEEIFTPDKRTYHSYKIPSHGTIFGFLTLVCHNTLNLF